MKIYENIIYKASKGSTSLKSLIDTGATVTMIPISLAKKIGAYRTDKTIKLVGVHGQEKTCEVAVLKLYFPSLDNLGGALSVAVTDFEEEPLIGMDILSRYEIIINTQKLTLETKKPLTDLFKDTFKFTTDAFLSTLFK
jgi:predicted aspartyl protease